MHDNYKSEYFRLVRTYIVRHSVDYAFYHAYGSCNRRLLEEKEMKKIDKSEDVAFTVMIGFVVIFVSVMLAKIISTMGGLWNFICIIGLAGIATMLMFLVCGMIGWFVRSLWRRIR